MYSFDEVLVTTCTDLYDFINFIVHHYKQLLSMNTNTIKKMLLEFIIDPLQPLQKPVTQPYFAFKVNFFIHNCPQLMIDDELMNDRTFIIHFRLK